MMEANKKVLYEAPATAVVEVKMEGGILTTSDYRRNDYYEE